MERIIFDNKYKHTFWIYVFISIIVAVSNTLFYSNKYLSLFVVILEIGCLIYLLITKRIVEYICFFSIFMCNCLEFSTLVGEEEFYGFKNFRILGLNLGLIMLIPIVIIGLVSIPRLIQRKDKESFKFTRLFIFITTISVFTGLLLFLFNDNGIRSLDGAFSLFIKEIYSYAFIPISMICVLNYSSDERKMQKISITLQAILWGNVFQMIVSILFGIRGTYSTLQTLQVSMVSFFVPLMILLFFDKRDICYRKTTLILGIIGMGLLLFFNSNGKIILLSGISIVIFIFKLYRSGDKIQVAIASILSLVLIVGGSAAIGFLSTSQMFKAKFDAVVSMLDFTSEDFMSNMNMSVRIRVEEFNNTFLEYAKKPFLFIFGKGYMGSITDNNGYFSTIENIGFVGDLEWEAGIYYKLHEIVIIFLIHGFFGIVVFFAYALKCFKSSVRSNNVWGLFGLYWLLMFYGFSFTIGCFGMLALLYSLNRIKVKEVAKVTKKEEISATQNSSEVSLL